MAVAALGLRGAEMGVAMVTMVEAEIQDSGLGPQRASGEPHNPALLAATLVTALEEALLVARHLLDALGTVGGCQVAFAARPAAVPVRPPARPAGLSRREAEVLQLLAAGHSNHGIAHALCLSPRTVQRHVANLYPKIDVHCRAEATAYALRHGLA